MSAVMSRCLLLLLLLLLPGLATAQALRTERLSFATGDEAVLLRGAIQGQQAVAYLVALEPGQRVNAELTSEHRQLFMNVRAPGGTGTTQAGPTAGNRYAAEVTAGGDLRLTIFLLGEAARRGDTAEYALSVEIMGAPRRAEPPRAAPAPAPSAPPAALPPAAAMWSITGLPRGQRLNLRAGPSIEDRIVARLPAGERLRAAGECREVAEERWCQVAREDGAGGWAAARFLAPLSGPPVATPAAPARAFDATGFLPCAMVRGQPSRDCRFGVTRAAPGAAALEVLGGNGVTRRIIFEGGAPRGSDAAASLGFERFGELFLIRIGEERFEVPEAVITGG